MMGPSRQQLTTTTTTMGDDDDMDVGDVEREEADDHPSFCFFETDTIDANSKF